MSRTGTQQEFDKWYKETAINGMSGERLLEIMQAKLKSLESIQSPGIPDLFAMYTTRIRIEFLKQPNQEV